MLGTIHIANKAVRRQIHVRHFIAVRGFTLVELLVVIAIITALASMLLPVLRSGIELARKTACANNLKQVGFANSLYLEDHNSWMHPNSSYGYDTDGSPVYPHWSPFYYKNEYAPYSTLNGKNYSNLFICPSKNLDRYTSTTGVDLLRLKMRLSYAVNPQLSRWTGQAKSSSSAHARLSEVRRPSQLFLFGDYNPESADPVWFGEPWLNHPDPTGATRNSVDFRHVKQWLVIYCDYHVDSWSESSYMSEVRTSQYLQDCRPYYRP